MEPVIQSELQNAAVWMEILCHVSHLTASQRTKEARFDACACSHACLNLCAKCM